MHRYQKPANLPTPTKQFPFLSTGTNLIQVLCRQKNHQNTKSVFNQLHRNSLSVFKKSTRLAKLLNKLIALKELKYKKIVIGVLYQLKISQILAKRQKVNLLKQKSRTSASSLIGNLMAKNLKSKMSEGFFQLRSKKNLIKQQKAFKILNLMNSIKFMEDKLLRKALRLIKVDSFGLLVKYKRCYVIERFYTRKRVDNLAFALEGLRNSPQKAQQKPKPSNPLKLAQPLQGDILKDLQEQKKQLQTQMNQLKASNRTNLKVKQSQLQNIQSEYESLRFNFDLITQENSELVQSINERERLASQVENRKRQQEQAIATKRSIPDRVTSFNQNNMWKSVFDNLICYLYKLKAGYDNQLFSLETMLDKMTQPLISLSVYAEKAQLQQENQVLRDLLNSYQAAFNKNPSEDLSDKPIPYPLEIINKQRRYLYLALDCLTRWGTTEAQGLDEIKSVLQKVKEQQDNAVVSVEN